VTRNPDNASAASECPTIRQECVSLFREMNARAKDRNKNAAQYRCEGQPEWLNGICSVVVDWLRALRAMIAGNKRSPAFRPKEAPTPDSKIRLGLIGLKKEAIVMTAPPAR
jgi:hypothetical protein